MKFSTRSEFIEFKKEFISLLDRPTKLFPKINLSSLNKAQELCDISESDEEFLELLKSNNINF